MKIVNVDSLPDIATRTDWAKMLDISTMTLIRWEKLGLKRSGNNWRPVLYRRSDILQYIGVQPEMTK